MTENRIMGLQNHNEDLNKLVCESLQTALLLILKNKEYSKISVTEICQKAGVSRTAFYNNFQTIDNLLERVVLEYNKTLIIDKIGSPFRETTNKEWYIKLFMCVKENADFLLTLFNAGFQGKYLSIINDIVLHNKNIPSTKKYLRIIWAGGIVNTVISWVEDGMKEDIEEIADFCFQNLSVCPK